MHVAVSLIAFFWGAVAVSVVVAPGVLLRFLERVNTQAGHWPAVVVRLVAGIVFVVAAPQCRAPDFILIAGVVAIIAAGLIALAGRRRRGHVAWFRALHPLVIRAWALGALAIDALIVFASGWPPIGT